MLGVLRKIEESSSGFTLLELLIVLAILGLAAGFAAPRLISRDSATVKVQARRIVAALKYARRIAIIEGKPKKFTLQQIRTPDQEPSRKFQVSWMNRGSDLVAGHQGTEPQDLSHRAALDKDSILFFPDGSSTGGKLRLGDQQHRLIIEINPLDGTVKVQS